MTRELDFSHVPQLPANLYFGTSTWTYEGWKGLVYKREYPSKKVFNAECLREYASCPLFRCVGIDSTFYQPPARELLLRYAELLPQDFLWVSKVWERVTVPCFPEHARYGRLAGTINPDFLNAELFKNSVLPAYTEPAARSHAGPFVFQFGTLARSLISRSEFMAKLGEFLKDLPAEFRYAVEVRNPEYLCDEYFHTLNERRVAHCFNHWNRMPPLKEQMKAAAAAGGLAADFYITRILTPLGIDYARAVERFRPYEEIRAVNQDMRQDVVRFAKRAIERGKAAYILVNNRAEGNAPQTIAAIGKMIVKD